MSYPAYRREAKGVVNDKTEALLAQAARDYVGELIGGPSKSYHLKPDELRATLPRLAPLLGVSAITLADREPEVIAAVMRAEAYFIMYGAVLEYNNLHSLPKLEKQSTFLRAK